MSAYAPVYSISKAAVDAFTRILADTYRADGVLVNAVDPDGSERTWAVLQRRGHREKVPTRLCGWPRCRTVAPRVDSSVIGAPSTGSCALSSDLSMPERVGFAPLLDIENKEFKGF
jgi:NAD(P)-dependent dehydrogenase (short-subunit alcohol dehydrogenase family)